MATATSDTTKTKNQMSPNEKISKALNLVNEARQEKVEDSKQSLNKVYEDGLDTLNRYQAQAKDQWNTSVETAETKVKAHPFRYVFGASIIGLVLGFLFSSRNK